jgi:hypothetical protein
LVAVAAIQVGALAMNDSPPPGADSLGALFGAVELIGAGGEVTTLASGQPTIVLVFHSACGHCRTVAPDWADWLATRDSTIRVVAVSREPYESALAYADEFGWQVDVRVTEPAWLMPRANVMTARTPWVYGLDSTGRVVAAAHGSEVRTIASALSVPGSL